MPQYKKKDIKRLKDLASKGNINAQCELATCYSIGNGVKKDEKEAFEWFLTAAQQGSAEGMGAVAICYENGLGTKKDETAAIRWYRRAAENGNPRAQRDLALIYAMGKGMEKDASSARHWMTLAATQGEPEALVDVADMCADGIGGPKDFDEAERWYRKALAAGDRTASSRIALLNIKRRAAEGDAEAQYEAGVRDGSGPVETSGATSELIAKSADQGYAPAQFRMGEDAYANGDYDEAAELFSKAADQGNASAISMLGVCYGLGRGVKRDHGRSAELLVKAAEMDVPDACRIYGRCLLVGRGVDADPVEAEKWFRKSIDLGSRKALLDLGCCRELEGDIEGARDLYDQASKAGNTVAARRIQFLDDQAAGCDSPESMRTIANGLRFSPAVFRGAAGAVGLYRRAADAGDIEAMVNLGVCYRCGIGVEEDHEDAFGCFKNASDAGDDIGRFLTGLCYSFGCGTKKDDAKGTEMRKGLIVKIADRYDVMMGMISEGQDPGNLFGSERPATAASFYD